MEDSQSQVVARIALLERPFILWPHDPHHEEDHGARTQVTLADVVGAWLLVRPERRGAELLELPPLGFRV